MSTLSSVSSASAGGAAIVTTGGAAGSAPVIIQTPQDADVLIVAMGDRCGCGGAPAASTPRRPSGTEEAGWCVATTARTPVATKTTSSTSKSSDPLAFLSDSKLSVEEKLMKFLAWVSDKNEKDLLKKMDEIYAKQQKKESGGKGFLGSIAGGAGKLLGSAVGKMALAAIPGVGPFLAAGGIGLDLLKNVGGSDLGGQIAGPILGAGASVLGFPQLAPALMKVAPALEQGAMSLLGATGAAGASQSSGGSTTRSKDGDVSQMDLMDLQIIQDRQKQAFGTISNILKGIHEVKMSVINNLRA